MLKGKALYRGIIDIVPSVPLAIPDNLSLAEKTYLLHKREIRSYLEPLKVLYFLLPTAAAGKWKAKEALDQIDVIECVKEHPGISGREIQHTLNYSPNKTVRLLKWLQSRRILHRRGASKSSAWYINIHRT